MRGQKLSDSDLALSKGTTYLDPLWSAGFGAEVPVFYQFDCFFFFKCRFVGLSAGFAGKNEKMIK